MICMQATRLFYHVTKGIPLKGVIFDMDGTLTVPAIDFALMRRRLGIPVGQDILRTVAQMPPPQKTDALRIIDEVEAQAREKLELQPGVHDVLAFLHKNGFKTAIISRNSTDAIEHFEQFVKQHVFTSKVSRDCVLPLKPCPDTALYVCQEWGLSPSQVMFVGDARDDMLCGKDAGNVTVLLKNKHNAEAVSLADFSVEKLNEVVDLIENGFNVTRYVNKESV